MNNDGKKDTIPMGMAIAIIIGVIIFVIAFFSVGGFILFRHMQNPAPQAETNQIVQQEPPDYVQVGQQEVPLAEADIAIIPTEPPAAEDAVHPIVGSWEFVRVENLPPGAAASGRIDFYLTGTGNRFDVPGLGAGPFPFDWHIISSGLIYMAGSGEVEYEITGYYLAFINRAINASSIYRRAEAVSP